MKNELLTVQEAADFIGVSPSTLKRLCESASVPVFRTPGGHRRIDKMDLDRIVISRPRFLSQSAKQQRDKCETTSEMVLASLMNAKPTEVAELLLKSTHSNAGLIAALEDCLVAALWKVGQLWRDDKIDVYQEHICTNAALTAIDLLQHQITTEANRNYVAIGGSMGATNETVASKLIALCLFSIGITSVDLGCMIPPASLARAAVYFEAKLVWVTHTHVMDVDQLFAWHEELKSLLPTNTRIVIGGGGLSPAIRRSLPWCEYYETLSELTKLEGNRLLALENVS
ncbi:MAG: helix-turn-helix domain-containing protein [Planctomycetota bacterium]|nr:helix-turn-helix domain-containing protein [Planctomycetota bacterium]